MKIPQAANYEILCSLINGQTDSYTHMQTCTDRRRTQKHNANITYSGWDI